ncbi:hypothetical protein QQF64_009458 [Cirrhinus molitorella]|uniref:Uncharacterized protein n=1 Tax=Cirrhinus molitorella TaxID=172907 RepID=A0ABR3M3R5_9TELE
MPGPRWLSQIYSRERETRFQASERKLMLSLRRLFLQCGQGQRFLLTERDTKQHINTAAQIWDPLVWYIIIITEVKINNRAHGLSPEGNCEGWYFLLDLPAEQVPFEWWPGFGCRVPSVWVRRRVDHGTVYVPVVNVGIVDVLYASTVMGTVDKVHVVSLPEIIPTVREQIGVIDWNNKVRLQHVHRSLLKMQIDENCSPGLQNSPAVAFVQLQKEAGPKMEETWKLKTQKYSTPDNLKATAAWLKPNSQ